MHILVIPSSTSLPSLIKEDLELLDILLHSAVPMFAGMLLRQCHGAKTFLHMRQNLLDSLGPRIALPLGPAVSVQTVEQRRQRKQVQNAERRPARRNPRKRIHCPGAGKRLANRAHRSVIGRVVNQPDPRYRHDLDQLELAPPKGMKRVRHTNALLLHAQRACS